MRGRDANPSMDRCKADQIGMLATVMNALYISDFINQKGMSSIVMTPFPVGNMTEIFSKDLALKYLSDNKIIIFAGGIGHPFSLLILLPLCVRLNLTLTLFFTQKILMVFTAMTQ